VPLLRERWRLFLLARRPDIPGGENIQTIPCDLAQEWNTGAFPEKVDAVIHLAQSELFREFPLYAERIFKVNTSSTLRLLEYARLTQVKTFVLASSGGIYGYGDEGFREDESITAKGDLGFYLGTKLCAEVIAEKYSPFMNIVILRFFFIYGPGQRAMMLIPRLVQTVKEGQPIILHGREGLKINPTYVTDAACAVCRSLELRESHKINIAGPEVLSLRQIGQQIGEVLKREPIFDVQENIKPQHLVGDIKKMTHVLGPPVVRFREGIAQYIEEQSER
jgi:nucleoside-diphosphate-sugar epimerase